MTNQSLRLMIEDIGAFIVLIILIFITEFVVMHDIGTGRVQGILNIQPSHHEAKQFNAINRRPF